MCCWWGIESKGLMLNDLHPHPPSILNFKFIIRKHTLAEGSRGEMQIEGELNTHPATKEHTSLRKSCKHQIPPSTLPGKLGGGSPSLSALSKEEQASAQALTSTWTPGNFFSELRETVGLTVFNPST